MGKQKDILADLVTMLATLGQSALIPTIWGHPVVPLSLVGYIGTWRFKGSHVFSKGPIRLDHSLY